MRFGFCTGIENAEAIKAAGYDYIELNLSALAKLPDETVREYAATLKGLDMRAETYNVIYSGQMIVGENALPEQELRDYTHRALERAALLGGEIIVYGSSAARNIPEGFSREKACEQFCNAARLTGDVASQYGLTVVLEALNTKETNFIHTIAEGYEIMKKVDHPDVRILADLYHVCQMNEGFEDIIRTGKDLRHVHVAEPVCRTVPSMDDAFDYTTFAEALRSMGYDARISIEARLEGEPDFSAAAKRGLQVLKTYF